MDCGAYTVHGFRSALRSFAAYHGFAREVAEAALRHVLTIKQKPRIREAICLNVAKHSWTRGTIIASAAHQTPTPSSQ